MQEKLNIAPGRIITVGIGENLGRFTYSIPWTVNSFKPFPELTNVIMNNSARLTVLPLSTELIIVSIST
jgi:hypothetical protein